MNQKGFSSILIILVMLAVLVGAIYLNKVNTKLPSHPSPTPSQQIQDETAVLKTYTNTKFAFSLKYPSTYRASNGVVELKADTDDSALLLLTDTKNSNYFFVSVVTKKQYADPHAYNGSEYNPFTSNIDKFLASKIGDKISIANGSYNRLSDTKIGDKTALVFEYSESKNEGYLVINTQKYIYVLGRYNGELKSFQEIFSTFEFLDQNQTSNQTYLYLARKSVFLHNTENVGVQGTEKTGGAPVNIVIPLPNTAVVQTLINQDRQQKSSVTINGSEFWVNVFGNPNEGCAPSCTGADSTFDINGVHVDTLRIWKDSRGVIDINPQTVIVNNYSIPYFTIQKNKPNNVFTDSEVKLWTDLLGKMKTIPVSQ